MSCRKQEKMEVTWIMKNLFDTVFNNAKKKNAGYKKLIFWMYYMLWDEMTSFSVCRTYPCSLNMSNI